MTRAESQTTETKQSLNAWREVVETLAALCHRNYADTGTIQVPHLR
jgi:hypothetical protein